MFQLFLLVTIFNGAFVFSTFNLCGDKILSYTVWSVALFLFCIIGLYLFKHWFMYHEFNNVFVILYYVLLVPTFYLGLLLDDIR